MIKYEEVKNTTTEEYFNNNQFSVDAFNKKYKIDDESYVQAIKRVCDFIASAEETKELQKYWSERWFDEIYNDWWHPAGSIMQGANSGRKISLANCTTISLGAINDGQEWDNLESIIRNTAYTVAKTAAYRQGLGVDFSAIRPKKSIIHNSANFSDGAIHWMKFIDSIGYYVGQKGRRPAMLFSLNIKHPDTPEFIEVKKDFTQIQNANISVQITDDFYDAVEKDLEWQLEFIIKGKKRGSKRKLDKYSKMTDDEKESHDIPEQKIIKIVKARKLLKLIAENMLKNAEPGIQNIDLARKYSNSDAVYDKKAEYDSRIISTNACSEQMLSRDALCVLSSINMGKFSTSYVDYEEELYKIAFSINRFLDNVNTMEIKDKTYATPLQKLSIENLRRTGAGITNLSAWLFKAGIEYGSEESLELIDKFIGTYNYHLYKSTIELGREKGSYKLFDSEKIYKSQFIKELTQRFPDIEFDAMRNVTLSSVAPTGTLSLMFRDMTMSSGIEPPFGLYYWKRTRISGNYEYYFIVPSIVRVLFETANIPLPMNSDTIKDNWEGKKGKEIAKIIEENKEKVGVKIKKDTEIFAKDKLKLMSIIMKHIDSSISVTYNLPQDSTVDDVYDFILESRKMGIKSVAAFPDKKMYGIVSSIPFKELAFNLIDEGIKLHPQNFSEEEKKELNLTEESLNYSTAPKRPNILDADIYSITAKGNKYVIAVGLLNDAPYEIFGGHMNGLNFRFNYREGKLEKVKRGIYKLEFEDIVIEDFSKQFTPVETTLFRLLSSNLRHGVPVKFLVEQLNKSNDDIFSLPTAISRVLKRYIVDGEQVSGTKCPSCGSESLYYRDGCVTCSNCEWSKCN